MKLHIAHKCQVSLLTSTILQRPHISLQSSASLSCGDQHPFGLSTVFLLRPFFRQKQICTFSWCTSERRTAAESSLSGVWAVMYWVCSAVPSYVQVVGRNNSLQVYTNGSRPMRKQGSCCAVWMKQSSALEMKAGGAPCSPLYDRYSMWQL